MSALFKEKQARFLFNQRARNEAKRSEALNLVLNYFVGSIDFVTISIEECPLPHNS